MKICLIYPSLLTSASAVGVEITQPLGIALLAGYLRASGHEVSFIDAIGEAIDTMTLLEERPSFYVRGLSDEDIVARIPEETQAIGVSCMFSVNWVINRRLIRAIRQRFPDVPLIIGGEHATALAEYSLRDAGCIDFVVLGEGENTTTELLDALDAGTDPTTVPGLGFLRDGTYITSPPRARERQIDKFPRPAWDLVPVENYFHTSHSASLDCGRTMPIIASRGCPYGCAFCSSSTMWGHLWRPRPPEEVVDEIESYVHEYKINHVDFWDLTLIVKRSWIIEFCKDMIARDLKISWQIVTTRSEAVDAEVAGLLKKSGCNFVYYAPESGSNKVLKAVHKKVNKEAMLKAISVSEKAGLGVKLNYIVGFPDDRFVDILASYWMAIRATWCGAHDASFFPFSPYPGSELFRRLLDEGRIKINDDYFFGLANYNLGDLHSWARNFSNRQISWLCLTGMALFYAANFIRRPWRFFCLIRDLALEQGHTKLSAALVRVIKNTRARHNSDKHPTPHSVT